MLAIYVEIISLILNLAKLTVGLLENSMDCMSLDSGLKAWIFA